MHSANDGQRLWDWDWSPHRDDKCDKQMTIKLGIDCSRTHRVYTFPLKHIYGFSLCLTVWDYSSIKNKILLFQLHLPQSLRIQESKIWFGINVADDFLLEFRLKILQCLGSPPFHILSPMTACNCCCSLNAHIAFDAWKWWILLWNLN